MNHVTYRVYRDIPTCGRDYLKGFHTVPGFGTFQVFVSDAEEALSLQRNKAKVIVKELGKRAGYERA